MFQEESFLSVNQSKDSSLRREGVSFLKSILSVRDSPKQVSHKRVKSVKINPANLTQLEQMNKVREMANDNKYLMFPALREPSDLFNLSHRITGGQRTQFRTSLDSLRKLPTHQQQQRMKEQKKKKDINETLRIDPELQSVKQPPRAFSKSEVNTQVYLKSPKTLPQKYMGIDNQLKVPFPLHNNKDFVYLHSLGFKGKENVDLFKHYLRMYMKNKHKIKAIKKARKEKAMKYNNNNNNNINNSNNLFEDSRDSSLENSLDKRMSVVDSLLDGKTVSPYATFNNSGGIKQQRNTSYCTQFRKSQDLIRKRLNLQEFVVEKSLNDLEFYSNVLQQYEATVRPLQNKDSERKSLLEKLKEKTQNRLNMVIVEADSGMMPSEVEEERKLILEDFFLKQIIMKITKYGLKIMSEADYLEFKRIANQRHVKLTELKNQLLTQKKLFQIKQRVQETVNVQRKESEHNLEAQYQRLKQNDYLRLTSLSKHYDKCLPRPYPIELSMENNQTSFISKFPGTPSAIAKIGSIKLSPISKTRPRKNHIQLEGLNQSTAKDGTFDNSQAEEGKQEDELSKTFLQEELQRFQDRINFFLNGKLSQQQIQRKVDDATQINSISQVESAASLNPLHGDSDNKLSNESSIKSFPNQQSLSIQEVLHSKLRERVSTNKEKPTLKQQNFSVEQSYLQDSKSTNVLSRSLHSNVGESISIISQNEDDPLDLLLDIAEKRGIQDQLFNLFEESKNSQQDQQLTQFLQNMVGSISEEDLKERIKMKYKIHLQKNKNKVQSNSKPNNNSNNNNDNNNYQILDDLSMIRPTSRELKVNNSNYYHDNLNQQGSFSRMVNQTPRSIAQASHLKYDSNSFANEGIVPPGFSSRFFTEESSDRQVNMQNRQNLPKFSSEDQQDFKIDGQRNDFIVGDNDLGSKSHQKDKRSNGQTLTQEQILQNKMIAQLKKKNQEKMNLSQQRPNQMINVQQQTSQQLMRMMAINKKERSSPQKKVRVILNYDSIRNQSNEISGMNTSNVDMQKIQVEAQKMKIEQQNDNIDPEMLEFQNILVSHKKLNESMFKRVMEESFSKKNKSHLSSRRASQYSIINQKEDHEILEQISVVVSPDFLEVKDTIDNTEEVKTIPIKEIEQQHRESQREKIQKTPISSFRSKSQLLSTPRKSKRRETSERLESELNEKYTGSEPLLTSQDELTESRITENENDHNHEDDFHEEEIEVIHEEEREEIQEHDQEVIDEHGNKIVQKVPVKVKVNVKVPVKIKIPLNKKTTPKEHGVKTKKKKTDKKSRKATLNSLQNLSEEEEEPKYEQIEVEEIVKDEKGEEVKVKKIIQVVKPQVAQKKQRQIVHKQQEEDDDEGENDHSKIQSGEILNKKKPPVKKTSKKDSEIIEKQKQKKIVKIESKEDAGDTQKSESEEEDNDNEDNKLLKKKKKEEKEAAKKEKKRLRDEEKRQKEEQKKQKLLEKQRLEAERKRQEEETRRIKEEKEQRLQNELEKFRKCNFADEMENLKNRKLTLKELRAEIEQIIDKLQGFEDSEAKHNILSYQQRIEQVMEFLEKMDQVIEATIEDKEDIQEFLSKLFNTKNRWTRDNYKDILMKFQGQMAEVEPMGEGVFADVKGMTIGQDQIQLLLKYESLNRDFASILQRILSFKDDRVLLNEFKVVINQMYSQVRQTNLDSNKPDFQNPQLSYGDKLNRIQSEKTFKRNTKHSSIYNALGMKESESCIDKLRRLKKKDPNRFEKVVSSSSQIKGSSSFLNAVQYQGIEKDIISTQQVQSKANYWKNNFNFT